MKEIEPRRKPDWLVRGALILGLAIGLGAVLEHEAKQENQIKSLTAENQRRSALPANLQGELFLLWVSSCINQSKTDMLFEGKTDITSDPEGLQRCKNWVEIWSPDFKGR